MHELPRPEREPVTTKLVTAVTTDFPEAREVLVSYPDQWELIHSWRRQDWPLYAAGLPPTQERPRRDHFRGLPPAINLALTTYRAYKLFEPWPQHVIPVHWDPAQGEGRVAPGGYFNVRLQPIAKAQVWTGDRYGLIWECYAVDSQRREHWQAELATFWRAVEHDMDVAKTFTQPHEPAFPDGYTDFLSALGYQPDADYPLWWSRER
jgi:hypothetical protein